MRRALVSVLKIQSIEEISTEITYLFGVVGERKLLFAVYISFSVLHVEQTLKEREREMTMMT